MKKFYLPLIVLLIFVVIIGGSWLRIFNDYWQLVLLYMGINVVLTVSLNLINGYMGEFSCGHAGFMAVGAYVTSVLTVWLFADDKIFGPAVLPAAWAIPLFPVALVIGAIAASLVGLLVAFPSFRTRGDYLAIITLAVNYIVKSAIENMEVIGGPRGFVGMKRVMNGMAGVFNIPWAVAAHLDVHRDARHDPHHPQLYVLHFGQRCGSHSRGRDRGRIDERQHQTGQNDRLYAVVRAGRAGRRSVRPRARRVHQPRDVHYPQVY
jgi:ABC-type branched-subunit amino acid transport system permease subunit